MKGNLNFDKLCKIIYKFQFSYQKKIYFLEKQLNMSLDKAFRTKFSDYFKVGLYSTPIVWIIQLLLMKIYNSH